MPALLSSSAAVGDPLHWQLWTDRFLAEIAYSISYPAPGAPPCRRTAGLHCRRATAMSTVRLHLRQSPRSYSYMSKRGILVDTQSPYPSRTSCRVTHVPRMQATAVLRPNPLEGGQGGGFTVGLLSSVERGMVPASGEWHHA